MDSAPTSKYQPNIITFNQEDTLYLKMCIMGPPKTGKTYLAATGQLDERLSPMFYLSVEGGESGFKPLGIKMQGTRVTNHKDLMKTCWWIKQQIGLEKFPFKSLLLDTFSELYQSIILDCYKQRTGLSTEGETAFQKIGKFDWDDYGQAANSIRPVIKFLRDLPIHVVMTSHAELKDKDKPRERVSLAASEKSAEPVLRLFDIIGYYSIKKDNSDPKKPKMHRVLETRPRSNLEVGARGTINEIGTLKDPTMTDIMDLFMGERTNDNEEFVNDDSIGDFKEENK